MKKIQMVDLKGQYEHIKETVNTAIQEILDTTTYINGPQVHAFQKNLEEYLGVKHVIPCANGTDALQIAMMGLGLKPGDEVITADFTFAATVEVIALLQLTPVLVDVELGNMNISIEAIKNAITPKTRAIVPVHLFGRAANMEAIMRVAQEHNLYVIEDNAQAIGANCRFSDGTKKKAGTIQTLRLLRRRWSDFHQRRRLGTHLARHRQSRHVRSLPPRCSGRKFPFRQYPSGCVECQIALVRSIQRRAPKRRTGLQQSL